MGSYKGMQLVIRPTDSEHRGYLEEARKHHLVVQRCDACGMLRGAVGAACPFCTSLEWSWHPVSGKGVIYSYQIVAQAVQPAFLDWVPYPIVLVELDEQRDVPWRAGKEDETISLRVVANLCSVDPMVPEAEENVAIGKRVEVCFVDLDDTMALPQFRLSEQNPAPRS
jgi:uncharacterized OB-fold protein